MNELPTGWTWAELSQVCTSITDGDHQAPPQVPSGIPFLVIGNIRTGALDFTDCRHVPAEYFESLDPSRRPQKGDVLYSLVGSYGISVPVRDNKPFCVQRHIGILRPSPEISSAFLALGLSSRSVFDQATQYATGTAQLTVPLAGLRRIRIPLPPRPEQDRIVTAIEEQLSRLDAGVVALERARLNLRRMRTLAVSSLFDPSWPRVPLIDVLTLMSDCPHRTPTYTDAEGYPALRPRDVVGGELKLQASARVNTQEYRLQTARHKPEAGDVVYSRELSYGWAVELPEDPPVCLSQGMVLFQTTKLLPGFLALFLNSHEGRQQADRAATGTAHPHINLRDIKQYRVPLASHTDQRKVLALASGLLSECDQTSQSVATAMIRASALRNAVLSSAFNGKLAPQNPNDKPATILLEEIAAERASSNDHKTGRTRRSRLLREDAPV